MPVKREDVINALLKPHPNCKVCGGTGYASIWNSTFGGDGYRSLVRCACCSEPSTEDELTSVLASLPISDGLKTAIRSVFLATPEDALDDAKTLTLLASARLEAAKGVVGKETCSDPGRKEH